MGSDEDPTSKRRVYGGRNVAAATSDRRDWISRRRLDAVQSTQEPVAQTDAIAISAPLAPRTKAAARLRGSS